jgi:hypothetical protein
MQPSLTVTACQLSACHTLHRPARKRPRMPEASLPAHRLLQPQQQLEEDKEVDEQAGVWPNMSCTTSQAGNGESMGGASRNPAGRPAAPGRATSCGTVAPTNQVHTDDTYIILKHTLTHSATHRATHRVPHIRIACKSQGAWLLPACHTAGACCSNAWLARGACCSGGAVQGSAANDTTRRGPGGRQHTTQGPPGQHVCGGISSQVRVWRGRA